MPRVNSAALEWEFSEAGASRVAVAIEVLGKLAVTSRRERERERERAGGRPWPF